MAVWGMMWMVERRRKEQQETQSEQEAEDEAHDELTRECRDDLGGRKRFDFGKYRGKSFGDVYDSEQNCGEWAMKQEPTTRGLREFHKYVERRQAEQKARPNWRTWRS